MSKSAEKFESEIKKLKKNSDKADDDLEKKQSQGTGMIRKEFLRLIRDILKDDDLNAKIKLLRGNDWTFEISIDSMANDTDVSDSIKEIELIAQAAGIESPIR